MSPKLRLHFPVSRNGFAIEEVWLKDGVKTGITYENMTFPLWEAAIAAGATLDELQRIDSYPREFRAKVVAWHQKHKLVRSHEQDALNRAARRKSKLRGHRR